MMCIHVLCVKTIIYIYIYICTVYDIHVYV